MFVTPDVLADGADSIRMKAWEAPKPVWPDYESLQAILRPFCRLMGTEIGDRIRPSNNVAQVAGPLPTRRHRAVIILAFRTASSKRTFPLLGHFSDMPFLTINVGFRG